jgi:hypothetical protein
VKNLLSGKRGIKTHGLPQSMFLQHKLGGKKRSMRLL